ncbi:terminase large subunit [Periweissella fabaria]|uniref:Terminase large subunit n=1 Tax=Periweissella fabaria TaxID=546157 RepID=A0ABM8Z7U7_9LACO|nr:terminase TerL endonuclease subunit [Periweissella fabaria]MCM0596270.1 terminase large subunit [Periweissella fabaria]CAH0417478.1 hypothetical protein WFA24289_01819 [Periweissella fabaria]
MSVNPVTQYALDVQNGKILTGKLMKLATKRHLDDLKMQRTPEFPYYFDEKILKGFLLFASRVPDPDTNEPVPLMAWQKFALGSLVGWRSEKTNGKRFKQAVISIARAQGKTYMASVLATYDFFIQSYDRYNQDIIVASNTSDQTKKLFNYTKGTIEKLIKPGALFEGLREDISPRFMDVFDNRRKNQIVRLTADGGHLDSYHANTAVFDEAGKQINRDAFEMITSGQVKQPEGIFIMISTAYQNPNAPLREDIKMATEDIEKGKHELDNYFLAVWSQDDVNEVFEPETWIKSNPLLGLPEQHDQLLEGLISKRDISMRQGKLNDFLVKSMNVWVNAEQDAAFELEDINNTVIEDFDIKGHQVYIGFDNSMTSDDTALAFVFPYEDEDGKRKWHLYQHSFIPWKKAGSIDAKESQDGINYRQMEELGFADVTQHEKGLIDNDFVFTWLMDFVSDNNLEVMSFAYDSAHAYATVKAVEETTNWQMQPVRQGSISLNEPTKWLQDAFVEGRVTRFDDAMMEKSLMNAVIVSDNNGIKIDKNKASFKIDLVDALIDALFDGLYHFEEYGQATKVQDEYDRMSDQQVNELLKSGGFTF